MNDPRVTRLLDAVLLISGDLDLDSVLQRIIGAAISLVDARYGALGVISEHGETLSNFVHQGIDDATAAEIGHLPEGRGVLGLLIEEPHPLRLEDLASHPGSYGFPANHPPMKSFLGTPIRVRGQVFGNLYLTEKIGAESFSAADQDLVIGLAGVAGAAIENARLYAEVQRREAWRDAVLELSTAMLAAATPHELRDLIVRLGLHLTQADGGCLVGPTDGGLLVQARAGDAPPSGFLPARHGPVWETLRSGEVVRSPGGPVFPDFCLWAPVMDQGTIVAALGVGRKTAFSAQEEQQLTGFAAQSSVLWTYERAQSELQRLSLVEERERIGRDLHDTVIQRLFATGLSLQGTIRRAEDRPEVAGRLEKAVDDIDATIKEIRSTIFSLQRDVPDGESLRSRILDLVSELTPILPSSPRVGFEGALDTVVAPPVADHLLQVVREALTNVAKHARASEVDVRVGTDLREVSLRVRDDGVGIHGTRGGGFGLRNMRERAERLGGDFRLDSGNDGSGTILVWCVPVT